jgi:hypothetical protein
VFLQNSSLRNLRIFPRITLDLCVFQIGTQMKNILISGININISPCFIQTYDSTIPKFWEAVEVPNLTSLLTTIAIMTAIRSLSVVVLHLSADITRKMFICIPVICPEQVRQHTDYISSLWRSQRARPTATRTFHPAHGKRVCARTYCTSCRTKT